MKKILIVEDDKEINRLMCEYLMEQGYQTNSAENGLDAVRIVREQHDISLMILDLMLPFQSGDMVLSKIREFSDIPVIIVSAKDDTHSKIELIKMGADDYITKPFDLDELFARIEAVLHRYEFNFVKTEEIPELAFKNLRMNLNSKTALVCNKPLTLTSKEFAILELMLKNPTKLFSKVNLFENIWKEEYLSDDNTIKVHICNIRLKIKKLDPKEEYIETVWNMGYRLII